MVTGQQHRGGFLLRQLLLVICVLKMAVFPISQYQTLGGATKKLKASAFL